MIRIIGVGICYVMVVEYCCSPIKMDFDIVQLVAINTLIDFERNEDGFHLVYMSGKFIINKTISFIVSFRFLFCMQNMYYFFC